jgi:hypothetical protein
MAARWGASAADLDAAVAPTGLGLLGLPCQATAAAVNVAHADIAVFTGALAARVGTRAVRVVEADSLFLANEAGSANEIAAVARRATGV